MVKNIYEDIETAKRLCQELKAGSLGGIEEIYLPYHNLFLNFARKRLYNPDSAEDVVQSFWMELLNSKAICNYKGENNASLRTYLLNILIWRIIDENRKIEKERISSPPLDESNADIAIHLDSSLHKTPMNRILEEEREGNVYKLINESLLLLSEDHPKDGRYIKMHFLEGLSYEEMAIRDITAFHNILSAMELKRKTDAIKKQVTRPRTGSKARFRVILERLMKLNKLSYDDIITL